MNDYLREVDGIGFTSDFLRSLRAALRAADDAGCPQDGRIIRVPVPCINLYGCAIEWAPAGVKPHLRTKPGKPVTEFFFF